MKRTIKVPAISNKLADIPPDEYSWRKYGQKPIKGSPHPRYANFPICNCDYLFVPRTLLVMYKLDVFVLWWCKDMQKSTHLKNEVGERKIEDLKGVRRGGRKS